MTESQEGADQPRRKPGRPPILTPELIDQIALPVRVGNPIITAAAFAGVDRDTLYDWLRKAGRLRRSMLKDPSLEVDHDQEMLLLFSDTLRKAMAEDSIRDIGVINKAADAGAWQAAAWKRERREPAHFGRSAMYERASEAADELLPPGDQEGKVVPEVIVLPAALAADEHKAVVDFLEARGRLPGTVNDEGT